MKFCVCLLGTLFMLSPGSEDVSLKVKAPRMVFMPPGSLYERRPVSINLSARLEGDFEDPEKYYCLSEVWEWGDETESVYEPDCDPYEEGAEVKRFFSSHRNFRRPGTYKITLRLKNGDKTVISGTARVRIRGG